MTAVTEAGVSPKAASSPPSKQNDSPSLTLRISLVALACFATIVLGFVTNNVGYALVAAVAIGMAGIYCAGVTTLFDLIKNKPKDNEPYVDPNIPRAEKTKDRIKQANEERWNAMNEALGSENTYDNLHNHGFMTQDQRIFLPNFEEHTISRCMGFGPKDQPNNMLLLKLQNKSGGDPFMCTFRWTQPIGKEDTHSFWQCNVDWNTKAEVCFPPVTIVNETILKSLKQIREGAHPTYKLARPKIEVVPG